MDAEITALEAKLSKARQIKQGMMEELLTGKTRLVDNGKWKMTVKNEALSTLHSQFSTKNDRR